MTVRAVSGRRELSKFVNLPWRLHQDDPNWVAPFKSLVRNLLDQRKHPFYAGGREAQIKLFLAYDGNKPVGRVAAIINHTHNRVQKEQAGFFGFFESVNRTEVAQELLTAAEAWLDEQGASVVGGPVNPSSNYECGLLVKGFDRPPALMMTYNPAHYVDLIEGAGYTNAKDLFAYLSPVHNASLERLEWISKRIRRRNPNLVTRGVNQKEFPAEVQLAREIYNEAWEDNWGFVAVSDAEFDWLSKELERLVMPGLVRFAFIDGEAVGLLLCVPDWNPVMNDLDGSPLLHPLRTLKHLMWTRAENLEGLRLILLGVKSSFRDRGIEGVLIAEGLRVALDAGYQWCEYSWILEDNDIAKRAVRLMGGELYKIYRIYEKTIG